MKRKGDGSGDKQERGKKIKGTMDAFFSKRSSGASSSSNSTENTVSGSSASSSSSSPSQSLSSSSSSRSSIFIQTSSSAPSNNPPSSSSRSSSGEALATLDKAKDDSSPDHVDRTKTAGWGISDSSEEDREQKESKSDSDSDSLPLSQSSVKSREGQVSSEEALFLKSSIIQLHFKFIESKEEDQPDKLIYVLQFGNDRPPTIVSSGQGRHISPYCLLQEALINRVNGQNVEEAPKILKEFLLEYINEDQKILKALEDYVDLTRDKFKNYTFNERQREASSNSMKANNKLSEMKLTKEEKESLKKILGQDRYNIIKQARSANQALSETGVTIQRTRNQLKQGNIAADQEVLLETMKGVLTVLNKMEMVSFAGKKTGEDMGKEGGNTREVMTRLRKREESDYYDGRGDLLVQEISSDMYDLFDFPADEVIHVWENQWRNEKNTEWKRQWDNCHPIPKLEEKNKEYLEGRKQKRNADLEEKWKKEADNLEPKKNAIIESKVQKYFIPILQRHIKLVCEASPVINKAFKDKINQNNIIDGFLNKVITDGKWAPLVAKVSAKDLIQDVSAEDGRYKLGSKFDTHISDSLRDIVSQLEQNVKEAETKKQAEKFTGYFTKEGKISSNAGQSSSSSSTRW